MLLASLWLRVLFVFLLFNFSVPQAIVNTLPGYNRTLPFKLETGYVSVGGGDDVQLFYYFIESERNPAKDPLVFWLTGGPGCSAFSGLVIEIGPFAFDVEAFDGSKPSFLLNPYSWTKIASIIFLDSPVGTGFSYSTTAEGYYSSDTKTAQETYTFLQKWLLRHPNFIKNRLYIAGDSYAGKMVPIVVTDISRGNEAGTKPHMNLKGYFIGNPASNYHQDQNERIPYAHRLALISDEYFKLAESSCDGEYVSPDPYNYKCLYALQFINMCIDNIYTAQILEPNCNFTSPGPGPKWNQASPGDDSSDILLPSERQKLQCRVTSSFVFEHIHICLFCDFLVLSHTLFLILFVKDCSTCCQDYSYVPLYVWANDPSVQEALQIRKGTKREWVRCNKSLAYEWDVESAFPYHEYLSKKIYEVLIYSGDHDMVIPYLGTLKWIRNLGLTLDYNWRPWYVDGQVAGYTEKYKEKGFSLTFATVKGAGHTAPEYKPKECFAMIDRWLSAYAL